jgi:hypothetical protein
MLMVTGLHARRQTLGKSGDGGERTQRHHRRCGALLVMKYTDAT